MAAVSKASASVLEDQQRFDALEALYFADGRGDRSHPNYGLYTGLFRAASGGVAVEAADVGQV
jgi:hypothetical protein